MLKIRINLSSEASCWTCWLRNYRQMINATWMLWRKSKPGIPKFALRRSKSQWVTAKRKLFPSVNLINPRKKLSKIRDSILSSGAVLRCFELFQWACKLVTLEQSPPYFLGYPGYITFYFISLFFLRVTENEGSSFWGYSTNENWKCRNYVMFTYSVGQE